MYQYLDGGNVRTDLIWSRTIEFNDEKSPFHWVDAFVGSPAA